MARITWGCLGLYREAARRWIVSQNPTEGMWSDTSVGSDAWCKAFPLVFSSISFLLFSIAITVVVSSFPSRNASPSSPLLINIINLCRLVSFLSSPLLINLSLFPPPLHCTARDLISYGQCRPPPDRQFRRLARPSNGRSFKASGCLRISTATDRTHCRGSASPPGAGSSPTPAARGQWRPASCSAGSSCSPSLTSSPPHRRPIPKS